MKQYFKMTQKEQTNENEDLLFGININDLESRSIHLTGVLTDENTLEVINALQVLSETSDDDIHLYINSDGGNTWDAFAICDIMRTIDCKVNTYALGRACSAGALILAAGTGTRYSYKNTRIMIHQANWDFSGKASEVEVFRAEFIEMQRICNRLLAESCHRGEKEIEELIQGDKWMSASEALELGLIDEIL